MSSISYGLSPDAWNGYDDYLTALIETTGARRVCEIGGGANPALAIDRVTRHGLDYCIVDISESELQKAPPGYRTIAADITDPDAKFDASFDLAFSKMLAEHVVDGGRFHRNVHRILRPGGIAFHFFPTLYAPPFIANRLMPERITERILEVLHPGLRGREGRKAKFPAYYSWCVGPLRGQISRIEALGYEVVEYRGFFGHANYYRRFPPLAALSRAVSEWLFRHPVNTLTSYAYLVLRKNA